MEISNQPVSNFFLSMYKHELGNCFNAAHQMTSSLLSKQELSEGILSDLRYDQKETFQESDNLFTKLGILLYPSIKLDGNHREADTIVQSQIDSMPPNPFKLKNSSSPKNKLPDELFSQITNSVLQLLTRDNSGHFESKQTIEINSSANSLSFTYQSEAKFQLLEHLSQSTKVFDKKSVIAFNYEFLLLMLNRYPIKLINEQSTSGNYSTTLGLTDNA